MSIERGDNNASQAQNTTAPKSTQQKAAPKTAGLSLAGLGRGLSVGFSRASSSDALTALQKALTTTLETMNPGVAVSFVPLDVANVPQMGISALSVVTTYDSVPYYYTLLLANTAAVQKQRTETYGSNQYDVINVPGAYNTSWAQRTIAEEVSRVIANGNKAKRSGTMVVQKEFDLTSDAALKQLLVNALFANDNEYRSCTTNANIQDLDLSKVVGNASLTSSVMFGQDDTIGIDGNPVRSDIIVAVSQQEQGSAQGQIPVTIPLTELKAFVDVVVDPNPQAQGNALASFATPAISYVPNLVITDAYALDVTTGPSTLLAVLSALAVVKDYGWIRQFKPRGMGFGAKRKEQDLRDVGAIGYEVNQLPDGKFEAYNTKAADFDEGQLLRMLAAHFQPTPMVSIDVPSCGPSSYILSSLVMAANAVPEAVKFWVQAADTLTGRKFSEFWNKVNNGQAPIGFVTNRVFLGYYVDSESSKDLRNIDHIAYLNMTGDGKMGEQFMSTNLLVNEPITSRLARRKKLLQRVLNEDNVVINDFADRVTFNADFLRCLAQAVEACGIVINPEVSTGDMSMQTRGVANYATSAMLTGQMGVFRDNFGGQGGYGDGSYMNNNNYGGQNSRW
jgi:hypothetical protein